jgi:anthranilate/para-aminobenzoate synthase component I
MSNADVKDFNANNRALATERSLHVPPIFWFDSSNDPINSKSIIVTHTLDWLEYNIHNQFSLLEQKILSWQTTAPQGGIAGWIDYDGNACLALVPQWHELPPGEAPSLDIPKDIQTSFEEGWLALQEQFSPDLSSSEFITKIIKAKDYISAGDIYQVNLSYSWNTPWPWENPLYAWMLYLKLRSHAPVSYGAWIHSPKSTILSASPELFLKTEGRSILTEPIKGTRPRDLSNPAQDQRLAEELLHNSKERAELLMITDLLRNDLGRICEYGSVKVEQLWQLKSHSHVHHLSSLIRGELLSHLSPLHALQTCLPGGSITGAPKKRASEIIAELEGQPRGLYTGTLGYWKFNGESQWNIAIRTGCIKDEFLRFGVGSGIVADSDPQAEWQETLDKASTWLTLK